MESTMSPLTLIIAREHQRELVKEAELLAMESRVQRPSLERSEAVVQLRQRVGHTMIRVGTSISGASIHSGEMIDA